MHITHAGNVGIGVGDPGDILEVSGNGTAGITISAGTPRIRMKDIDSNNWTISVTGEDLKFSEQTAGTVVAFTPVGMGIGTTTPLAKFDVNGDFRLSPGSTTLSSVIQKTFSYNLPNISSNDVFFHDFSMDNAVAGSVAVISTNEELPGAVFIGQTTVLDGKVRVEFLNEGSNNQNPDQMSFTITVFNQNVP